MTRVRVLYWKEIPVQIQAEDENDRVSRPLEDRFQEAIDRIAMFDGSAGSDDYLESWSWSEYRNVAGDAQQAAETLAERYNRAFPRISNRKSKGCTGPGAADRSREPWTNGSPKPANESLLRVTFPFKPSYVSCLFRRSNG